MGQHQRLGPDGELIHSPELTNYEKVRSIPLDLHVSSIKASSLHYRD